MLPSFFKTPADFRKWLAKNHAKSNELLVGFYKRGSGTPSITWPESVAEALCYGWIDGVRKRLDEDSYTIRFTPRKPTSTWSAINLKLAKQLIAEGRMRPAGLAAFYARRTANSGIYSYENRPQTLSPEFENAFKENKKAWALFLEQASWYRRKSIYWVMSAKKDATRQSRLTSLIEDCRNRRLIKPLKHAKTTK